MPIPRAAVDAFVRRLTDTGRLEGVDRRLRVELVLRELGIPDDPAQLRALLSPLVARNRDEQARFAELFDTHFELATAPRGSLPSLGGSGAFAAPVVPPPPPRRWRAAVATLAVAAMAAIVWLAMPPRDTDSIVPPPDPLVGVESSAAPSVDTAARAAADTLLDAVPGLPATRIDEPSSIAPTDIAAPAIGLVAFLLLLRWLLNVRRRRIVRRRTDRKRRDTPPFVWTPRPPAQRLFVSSEFFEAARIAQRRQRAPGLRVSIERSVSATVEAAGMPTIRFERASRPPEYLVLIERRGPGDHQALLFDALVQRLGQEGIFIERFFYERDPRVCRSERHGAMTLSDLEHRFRDHRLVMLGAGDGLLDDDAAVLAPWTAAFAEWAERAILTPNAVAAWGAREEALAELFAVLPAGAAGLRAIVEGFELEAEPDMRWWRESHGTDRRVPRDPGAHLPELRAALGEEVWRWLCACAVYPDLHWALTLYLGALPELGAGKAVVEDRLLRLASLPWFRDGFMPPELRARLLDGLSARTERAVREAILAVLGNAPPAPESAAGRWHEAQVLVQLVLTRPDDRATQDALRARLKELPRALLLRDPAARRRLGQVRRGRVARMIPAAARRFVYRDGISLFGVRPWAKRSAVAAMGAAILFLQPNEEDPTVTDRQASQIPLDSLLKPVHNWFTVPSSVQLVPAETLSIRGRLRLSSGTILDFRMPQWRSSDTTVATVDSSGRIRAVRAGTTNLAVTAFGWESTFPVIVDSSLWERFRAIVDQTPKTIDIGQTRAVAGLTGATPGVDVSVCNPGVAVSDSRGRVTAFEAGETSLLVKRGTRADLYELRVASGSATTASRLAQPLEFSVVSGQLTDVAREAALAKGAALAGENVRLVPNLLVVGGPDDIALSRLGGRAFAEIRALMLKGGARPWQVDVIGFIRPGFDSPLAALCDGDRRTFVSFQVASVQASTLARGNDADVEPNGRRGSPVRRSPSTTSADPGPVVVPNAALAAPSSDRVGTDSLVRSARQIAGQDVAQAESRNTSASDSTSLAAGVTRGGVAGTAEEDARFVTQRVRARQEQKIAPALAPSDSGGRAFTIATMPWSSYAFIRLGGVIPSGFEFPDSLIRVFGSPANQSDFEVQRVIGINYLVGFVTESDAAGLMRSPPAIRTTIHARGSEAAPCLAKLRMDAYDLSRDRGADAGSLLATRTSRWARGLVPAIVYPSSGCGPAAGK